MKRFYIPLGVFALLVVLFAVALVRAPEKGVIPSALIGKPAPQFTLPDLRQPGASISIADFKDRWVLVNMWATWCQPCRVEHPVLIDMERSGKVAILGVSYKDEEDKARKWLEVLGDPYAAVGVDKEGDVAIDYGLYGMPESFLVNPEGIIVHKIVGGVGEKDWREEILPRIEGRKK